MSEREQLINEIDQTPDILVKEVLNFLLFIKSRTNELSMQGTTEKPNLDSSNIPSFLNFIDQINAETSAEGNKNLPKDFAKNLDHYLHGTFKEQA